MLTTVMAIKKSSGIRPLVATNAPVQARKTNNKTILMAEGDDDDYLLLDFTSFIFEQTI